MLWLTSMSFLRSSPLTFEAWCATLGLNKIFRKEGCFRYENLNDRCPSGRQRVPCRRSGAQVCETWLRSALFELDKRLRRSPHYDPCRNHRASRQRIRGRCRIARHSVRPMDGYERLHAHALLGKPSPSYSLYPRIFSRSHYVASCERLSRRPPRSRYIGPGRFVYADRPPRMPRCSRDDQNTGHYVLRRRL